jgi:hypothetical protein
MNKNKRKVQMSRCTWNEHNRIWRFENFVNNKSPIWSQYHSLGLVSTLTKQIHFSFKKLIHFYELKLLNFHDLLWYFHMSSEVIQSVAYDKLWWFSICQLHIFTKIHYTILRIISWRNWPDLRVVFTCFFPSLVAKEKKSPFFIWYASCDRTGLGNLMFPLWGPS